MSIGTDYIIGQRLCDNVQWPRTSAVVTVVDAIDIMSETDEGRAGQRVWRLRKRHQWVDAELRVGDVGVDLQFFFNGELSYERRWPSRAEALAEAAGRRAELEREGWMAHW